MGLLSPRLVTLVGMPNCTSKNRERDGALALRGCHLVVQHNNQSMVGGSNGRDDGEDAQPGWSI